MYKLFDLAQLHSGISIFEGLHFDENIDEFLFLNIH